MGAESPGKFAVSGVVAFNSEEISEREQILKTTRLMEKLVDKLQCPS